MDAGWLMGDGDEIREAMVGGGILGAEPGISFADRSGLGLSEGDGTAEVGAIDVNADGGWLEHDLIGALNRVVEAAVGIGREGDG